MGRVFVVITTHTPRHLAACVRGVFWQHEPVHGLVVSSDRVDDGIPSAVRGGQWPAGPATRLVWREHAGLSRQAQVRNNAVRAMRDWALHRDDVLLFIDGDMVLAPTAVAEHRHAAKGGAELILGYRAELDEHASPRAAAAVLATSPNDASATFAGLWPADADAALRRREARYARAAGLASIGGRQVGLVKAHKPKVISCHVGVTYGLYVDLNGFDEAFEGHGYEDDDLGRRAYKRRPAARAALAITRARALHLWHPSRREPRPELTPQGLRFMRFRPPVHAEMGLDSPREQPPVRVMEIGCAETAAP